MVNYLPSIVFSTLYGKSIELEDIIKRPLTVEETLVQGGHSFYRVKVPNKESSLFDRIVFWVQINFNANGHLEAIPNLFNLFEQSVLKQPIRDKSDLDKIKENLNALMAALKADYRLVELNVKLNADQPFSIETRVKSIVDKANSNLQNYRTKEIHLQIANEQTPFKSFEEEVNKALSMLAFCNDSQYEKEISLLSVANQDKMNSIVEGVSSYMTTSLDQLKRVKEQASKLRSINSFVTTQLELLSNEKMVLLVSMEIVIGKLTSNIDNTNNRLKSDQDVHLTQTKKANSANKHLQALKELQKKIEDFDCKPTVS